MLSIILCLCGPLCYYYLWSNILLLRVIDQVLHLLISDEVRQDDAPASGLRHLVYELPGSVGASEAPEVVAPDHTLGAGANDVNLSVSDELGVSTLLQE